MNMDPFRDLFSTMNNQNQNVGANATPATSAPTATATAAEGRDRDRGGAQRAEVPGDDFDYWNYFQPWNYQPFYHYPHMPHRGRRGGHGHHSAPFHPPPPPNPPAPPAPPAMADPPPFPHMPGAFNMGPSSAPPPHRGPRRPSPSPQRSDRSDRSSSRSSSPPTPPEQAPEAPDRERSASPSPHRGHGRHHHGRHQHGRHHGRGGRGGRGGGCRRGSDRHEPWADRMRTTWGQQHRHGNGASGWQAGAHGPNPYGFDLGELPNYLNQLPGQVPAVLAQLFGNSRGATGSGADAAPSPEVDVFNMENAYIIHAYVPGAKKADLDVSYDGAKNSVKISGMLQRPEEVDERMIDVMIQQERKVGFFEKVVRLERDTAVDADEMVAKLEDGVLRIEIPKVNDEEWSEVKKVVIE